MQYSKYKQVDFYGVNGVPFHWDVVPIRHAFKMNELSLGENTPSDYAFLYLDIGSVKGGKIVSKPKKLSFKDAPSRARRKVRMGDTILSTVRTYLNAVYHFNSLPEGIIVSTGFAVLSPRSMVIPSFTGYLLQSYPILETITSRSIGVAYPGISETVLSGVPCILPPPSEQAAIVKYLDYMTRRIDKAIRVKKKLIQLLNEQKQVIIHQAVTRGLNPDVPLKDSGVPWLGMVPEHWEVRKVKHVSSLKSGEAITSVEIEESGTYPVYGGNGLRGYSQSYTHDGDFILIGRQGALCGNVNYANGKFWASEHAVVVRPLVKYDRLWFGELLRAMDLNQYSIAAAQPGLSVERIQNLQIPYPPYSEQIEISNYFDKVLSRITNQSKLVRQRIDLLEEYRTRLIADVVTGQIDVREIAAQLPDEQEDVEPFDLEDVEEVLMESEQDD